MCRWSLDNRAQCIFLLLMACPGPSGPSTPQLGRVSSILGSWVTITGLGLTVDLLSMRPSGVNLHGCRKIWLEIACRQPADLDRVSPPRHPGRCAWIHFSVGETRDPLCSVYSCLMQLTTGVPGHSYSSVTGTPHGDTAGHKQGPSTHGRVDTLYAQPTPHQ